MKDELEWNCNCVEMTQSSIVNYKYQVWIPVAAKDELEWICACKCPEKALVMANAIGWYNHNR